MRVESMTSCRSSDAGKRLGDAVQRDEQLVGRREPRDLIGRGFLVHSQLVDETAGEHAEHTAEQEQQTRARPPALGLRVVFLQGDDTAIAGAPTALYEHLAPGKA